MVRVENLSFAYDSKQVVSEITMDLEAGSTMAIIGPSGCGKTTLLYLLAGLLSHTQGSVYIDGQKLCGVRKDTGIILQNYGLFPWKTIQENVALSLGVFGTPKKMLNQQVTNILSELNLIDLQDKYPHQISGGQKQRAAIARTLVRMPDLLLMDEASSALDALTKETIQDMLLAIYMKNRTTMIFVTHSIEEAVFLGQKIVIMKEGRIHKIIEGNPVGKADYRKSDMFYQKCLAVRTALEETL
jgi:NitT/TauT family transport system ATP-binding protein